MRRYGELKKTIIPQITHKMLIQSLRELERDDIVMRHIYPQVPPRVEYALTEKGKSLRGVIHAMNVFAVRYPVMK
jgi:DNA-binding HxlR family transcriptional regulator